MVPTGTLVLALLVGVLIPAVNYWAILLLFLTGPVEGRLHRRAGALPADRGAPAPEDGQPRS